MSQVPDNNIISLTWCQITGYWTCMMNGRHRVVAKKIVCWLFHLRQLKEGALRLVLSAEPAWGRSHSGAIWRMRYTKLKTI